MQPDAAALAELPDPDDPARRIALDQKLWLRDLFSHLAEEAGATAPDELASQLFVLHEGALATLPLGLDTLRTSTELARALTRASVPDAQPVS